MASSTGFQSVVEDGVCAVVIVVARRRTTTVPIDLPDVPNIRSSIFQATISKTFQRVRERPFRKGLRLLLINRSRDIESSRQFIPERCTNLQSTAYLAPATPHR